MIITVKHESKSIELPSGTTATIGNSGIVRLYCGDAETAVNFKRITTAENMILHCYNGTDFAICEAFKSRAEKSDAV